MNVEIGTDAAQFPEKDYINGISLQWRVLTSSVHRCTSKNYNSAA